MNPWIVILLAIIFSALFSGMEIAFISIDNFQLEVEKRQKKLAARILSYFVDRRGLYIGTMLVGNNIALVIYGLATAVVMEPYLKQFTDNELIILLIQTIISTLVILFFAEFIPKSLFRINSNLTLKFFLPFILLVYYLFYPITAFTIGISNFIIRKVSGKKNNNTKIKFFGRADLNRFIEQFKKYNNQEIAQEIQIIKRTLDFEKVKARECLVPRNEIVALPIDATIEDLIEKMKETNLSKIVIYRKSIDDILGYVHSLALFKNPKSIEEIIVEMPIVPETMSAKRIYNILISQSKSMALVVDEYGGTSGIVTIEDILEEIFGEIQDEYDKQLQEQIIDKNTYIFSARLEIDYLNEKYNIQLPHSDEYETLAGLILNKLERIPKKGERILLNCCILEIQEVEQTRIKSVKIIKNG